MITSAYVFTHNSYTCIHHIYTLLYIHILYTYTATNDFRWNSITYHTKVSQSYIHPVYHLIIMEIIHSHTHTYIFITLTYIQINCKFSQIKKEFLNKPITKLNMLRSRAKCVLSQIFTSNTSKKWKYNRW